MITIKETQLILTDDLLFRNFRFFRQKFGLTRKTMALLLDMPPYFIRLIDENRWDDNFLPLATANRMAQIFGVELHFLLKVDYSAQPPAHS